MLIKRTNLLLGEADYQLLKSLAKKEEVSVAELIRRAIEKVYKKRFELEQRKEVVAEIQKLWKKVKTEGMDYKSLIENGRKY